MPIPTYFGAAEIKFCARILLCILQKEGYMVFERASEYSLVSTVFAYIAKHVTYLPLKYQDYDGILSLLKSSLSLPKAVNRRYAANLIRPEEAIETDLPAFQYIGCMNDADVCPSRRRYTEIQQLLVNSLPVTVDDIRFLVKFGQMIKFCSRCVHKNLRLLLLSTVPSRCKSVAYCSRECQKDDWIKHRVDCRIRTL